MQDMTTVKYYPLSRLAWWVGLTFFAVVATIETFLIAILWIAKMLEINLN